MTKLYVIAALLCLAAAASNVSGQNSSKPAEFEAVSVHRVAPGSPIPSIAASGGPGTPMPTAFSCRNCTPLDLVTLALNVKTYDLILPPGLEDEHYMVSARVPPDATKEDFRRMLQRLLVSRFHLKTRITTKRLPQLALRVARRGPKLPESVPRDPSSYTYTQAPGKMPELQFDNEGLPILPDASGVVVVATKNVVRMRLNGDNLDGFAAALTSQTRSPIVNETGLAGKYDITLTWTEAVAGPAHREEFDAAPDLAHALVAQLGLRLDRTMGERQVTAVERFDVSPTED